MAGKDRERVVGQVITVSVETMKLVTAFPPLDEGKPGPASPKSEVYTQAYLDAAHIYLAEDPPAE